jgi:RNA polymerase primary sigma factor
VTTTRPAPEPPDVPRLGVPDPFVVPGQGPTETADDPSAQPPDERSAQHDAWARAVEVGVLARAAREDPDVAWRGDATDEELRRLEQAGARARQQLVASNLGLVGSLAARYAGAGAPLADLFQEGCVGLIVAVERFDHRRGVRFSTYASYWVRACVSAAATRFAGAVTVPAHRGGQLRVARGVEGALLQHLGREPSIAEVAAALGRGERWTAGLLAQRPSASLEDVDDAALHRGADLDRGPATRTAAEAQVSVQGLLGSLDAFDRRVLELRFGFGGEEPTSLSAAARALRVPVGRVRRAEVRALDLLRELCPQSALTQAVA